jgi:type I restriction enzyme S subunit
MIEVEVKNVPAIRFPEFGGEWVESKLGEIFSNGRKKGNQNLPIYSVTQDQGLVPRKSLDRNLQNDAKPEDNIAVQPNNLVYNMMRMWQGAVGIASQACMVSPAYIVLKPKYDTGSKFFIYFFERKRSKYLFTAYSYGITSDRLRLYYKDFADIKLNIPTHPEQQKIASFLTTVDKRITLLKEKKAKLEQYKKGVMQQLFSQQIRFKDENGQDFPEWEEKKLGEIGSTFNGLTGKSKEDFGQGKPYIQYMQIFSHSKIDTAHFDYVNVETGEKQNQVQYGDIFFTTSSETPKEIGTASVLINHVDEVYLNSFCFGYRPHSLDELVPEFARYFFRSELVRKEIIKLAQGSTRFNMSKVGLMKLSFLFPSKKEQQKIASFLSSLDEQVAKVGQQIEQMSSWKKGLLQKMFV